MGIAHATSFQFSFAAERWSSENEQSGFHNNCRSVGFAHDFRIAGSCCALSLALSHGERGWVDREAKSGREAKNGGQS